MSTTQTEWFYKIIYFGSRMGSPYPERRMRVAYIDSPYPQSFDERLSDVKKILEVWEKYLEENKAKIERPYDEYVKFCKYCKGDTVCARHGSVIEIPVNWDNRKRSVLLSPSVITFTKEKWFATITRTLAIIRRPGGLVFSYSATAHSYWYLLDRVLHVLRDVIEYLSSLDNENKKVNEVIAKIEMKKDVDSELSLDAFWKVLKYFEYKKSIKSLHPAIDTLYIVNGHPITVMHFPNEVRVMYFPQLSCLPLSR